MRVRVQQSRTGGAREEEARQQLARAVALFLGALRDHVGHRDAVDPLRDQHLVALVHHVGHDHVGIVRELRRVLPLRRSLQLVVQLLRHPVPQLVDQGLDVHARDQRPQQPGEPAQLRQVREQRLPGPRVLHLDRHIPPVVPHRPVHLADRGGGRRLLLELQEQLTPLLTEPLRQHLVHRAGRHRRGSLLELGERRPIGARHLLGQRGLEDGQSLPELHGPALELAEHLEELVRRALLELPAHHLRGLAADPLAQTPGGTAGEAQWQRGQLGSSGDGLTGKIRHTPLQIPDSRAAYGGYRTIVSCGAPGTAMPSPSCSPAAPQGQAGCGAIRSERQSSSGSVISQRAPVLAGSSPSRKDSA